MNEEVREVRLPVRWKGIPNREKAITVWATALETSSNYILGITSELIPFIDVDSKEGVCKEYIMDFIAWVKRLLECDVALFETDRGYHVVPLVYLVNEARRVRELSARLGRLVSILSTEARKWIGEGVTLDDVISYSPKLSRLLEVAPPDVRALITRLINEIREYVVSLNMFRVWLRTTGRRWIMGKPTFEEFYRTILRLKEMESEEPHVVFIKNCVDELHTKLAIKYHRVTLRISPKPCKEYDIKLLGIY